MRASFEVVYVGGETMRVVGELDFAAAPLLLEHLGELVSEGLRELRLDLGSVTFMDSSGVRALLQTREMMLLTLVHPSPPVLRVLELTGLVSTFEIDPPVSDGR